jgi:hypothetical protein
VGQQTQVAVAVALVLLELLQHSAHLMLAMAALVAHHPFQALLLLMLAAAAVLVMAPDLLAE